MNNIFDRYPNMNSFFQTSDGTAFFEKSFANLHAKGLDDKKVVEVFKEKTLETDFEVTKETAQVILAKLPEMDLETAENYLNEENSFEMPRKTVVAGLEKKITELKSAATVAENATPEAEDEDNDENQEA